MQLTEVDNNMNTIVVYCNEKNKDESNKDEKRRRSRGRIRAHQIYNFNELEKEVELEVDGSSDLQRKYLLYCYLNMNK
jgi:small nuclear ribonucleoprotein (snRNP)-like protein